MKSTIEFDLSNETHRAAIRAMLDTLDGTAPQQVAGSAEPPKRKKADKPAAPVQPVAETPVQPVAETLVQPVAETPSAQTAVTVEQVRKAVSEITIAHPDKRETVRGILGEFGAENVSTLDASNYAAFLERLKTI